MTATLHQFERSHFNEKARWALAFKGVPHARRTYLPGPHMRPIERLSGQRQTPVLVLDETVISGSAAIIDHLERQVPEPALYPADRTRRAAALALQQRFDTEVGPAVRTALFSVMIPHGGYMCRTFSSSRSPTTRLLYRAIFPLLRGVIAQANGASDPDNVSRSFQRIVAALDEVAQLSAATGYLVGGRFTVADLSAAALLAPLASVTHADMARPDPVPAPVQALLDLYQEHPGIVWVNRMYRDHRQHSAS